jgi:hypothetical protein
MRRELSHSNTALSRAQAQIITELSQAPFRQKTRRYTRTSARALPRSPGQTRRLRPAAQYRTTHGGYDRLRPATHQGSTRSGQHTQSTRDRPTAEHAGAATEVTAPHLFPARETL